MPTYKARNKRTGEVVEFEWNEPRKPTSEEIRIHARQQKTRGSGRVQNPVSYSPTIDRPEQEMPVSAPAARNAEPNDFFSRFQASPSMVTSFINAKRGIYAPSQGRKGIDEPALPVLPPDRGTALDRFVYNNLARPASSIVGATEEYLSGAVAGGALKTANKALGNPAGKLANIIQRKASPYIKKLPWSVKAPTGKVGEVSQVVDDVVGPPEAQMGVPKQKVLQSRNTRFPDQDNMVKDISANLELPVADPNKILPGDIRPKGAAPNVRVKRVKSTPNRPTGVTQLDTERAAAMDMMRSPEAASMPVADPDITLLPTSRTPRAPRPEMSAGKRVIHETQAVPRSIMASFDLSAPLRQGATMIGRKSYWTALKPMVKSLVSEKSFQAVQNEIAAKPTTELAKKSGLALTDLTSHLSPREEQFASVIAEKIPGIRASGRAYTAFLNKLRSDTFDNMVKATNADETMAAKIADYVNNATGRGSLGKFEGSAVGLADVLFSPRLMASRVNMLRRVLDPTKIAQQPSYIRKQALRDMLTLSGTVSAVGGLATMAGAEFETDPRSSDFAKIKIGNTRVDLTGGFQQYIRAASQLASGQYIDSEGNLKELGPGIGQRSRQDVAINFLENKLAPVASFINTMLKGRDFEGGPVDYRKEIVERVTPMIAQDLYELYQEDPDLMPLIGPAMFGASVQSYGKRKKQNSARSGTTRQGSARH